MGIHMELLECSASLMCIGLPGTRLGCGYLLGSPIALTLHPPVNDTHCLQGLLCGTAVLLAQIIGLWSLKGRTNTTCSRSILAALAGLLRRSRLTWGCTKLRSFCQDPYSLGRPDTNRPLLWCNSKSWDSKKRKVGPTYV